MPEFASATPARHTPTTVTQPPTPDLPATNPPATHTSASGMLIQTDRMAASRVNERRLNLTQPGHFARASSSGDVLAHLGARYGIGALIASEPHSSKRFDSGLMRFTVVDKT